MKEVTLTIRARCTDEFYEKNIANSVAEIKSGEFQRSMKTKGVTKVTATVQVINIK